MFLLSGDGRFYLLALSEDEVRLWQCTHYGFKKIALPATTPPDLKAALAFDHFDREQQFHWHTGIAPASAVASHGKGMDQLKKENLLRYFQQVAKGLHEVLREERAPLILAGVDYLLPIYREANSYRTLIDEGITGNPEDEKISSEELHKKAWKIVAPIFQEAREAALSNYQQLAGYRSSRASDNIRQIVMESRNGRISTLLFASGWEQWGSIEPSSNEVSLHGSQQPCDYDLIDYSVAQTIINRGDVYPIETGMMPNGSLLAAVFRY